MYGAMPPGMGGGEDDDDQPTLSRAFGNTRGSLPSVGGGLPRLSSGRR